MSLIAEGRHAAAVAVKRPAVREVEESSALASTWGAFWRSRALVWVAGCLGFAWLGSAGGIHALDPAGVSSSFGRIGNVLMSPAVRWDSTWYLQIAGHGYRTLQTTAFFPLYPMLTRGLSVLTQSLPLAGMAISLGALFVAFVIVRRLSEFELGARPARAAVDLLAFTPMAVFFSAIYTESLFLALSAGTFYAARRGRWWAAGLLGALASATRLSGLLLVVPMLLFFLYGPRDDCPPARPGTRWRPRYRVTPQVLWVALIPCGAAAFAGYLALRGFGPLSPMTAEGQFWARETVTPLRGLIAGVSAAFSQARLVSHGFAVYSYVGQSTMQLAVLCVAGAALIGTFRRLPIAYGAYSAVALLLAISSTVGGLGLVSFDRYACVIFPLYMTAGAWSSERGLTRKLVLVSSLLLAFSAVQFATWRFVA
jgi:hypothetical protein